MWFQKIQEAKFTEHHNDSNTTSSQNNTMIPSNFDTPSHVTSKNNTLSNLKLEFETKISAIKSHIRSDL